MTDTPKRGSAAERRADRVRALEEERAGCKSRGLKDRVEQIDAELKRLSGKPEQRTAPQSSTTAGQ